MSTATRELEPKAVWNYFTDLNAVPRPSKKEERVIEFMMEILGGAVCRPAPVESRFAIATPNLSYVG